MFDRVSRFAPLMGLVFVVLAVVGTLTEKESPGASVSGAKVIAFYEANSSNQKSSGFLFLLAFPFFLFFAASLRGYLRRTPAAEPLSALVLAAAAILTTGVAIVVGIQFSLSEVPSHLEPAAAQALNALGDELFFPLAIGTSVFAIAAGLAILRGARLPNWLGWVAVLLGIASITPAGEIGFYGVMAGVWERLHRELLRRLNAAGQIDWSTSVVDGSHIRALLGGSTLAPRRLTVPALAQSTI